MLSVKLPLCYMAWGSRHPRLFGMSHRLTQWASQVKNPPANAGDMGSIPDLGRSHMLRGDYAHVPQLLSLCSRTWEPQLLRPHARTAEACRLKSLCFLTREATALRSLCTTSRN